MRKGYSLVGKVTDIKKDHLIETSEADLTPLKELKYSGNVFPIYNIALSFNGSTYLDYIPERYKDYSVFYAFSGSGVVQCDKNYLTKLFGENFELAAGSLYGLEESTELIFTDYMADSLLTFSPKFISKNKNDPYENILHKRIFDRYEIGAIVKTNYKENFSELYALLLKMQKGFISWNDFMHYMTTSNTFQKFEDDCNCRLNLGYTLNPNFMEDYAKTKNIAYFGNSFLYFSKEDSPDQYISVSGTCAFPYDPLEEDEAIATSTFYNSIFGTKIKDSTSEEFQEKTIYINNYGFDQDTSDKPKHTIKLKIVGAVESKQSAIQVPRDIMEEMVTFNNFACAYAFDHPKEAYKLHKTLVPQYYYTPLNAVESVFNAINVINIFNGIFQGIFVLLIAVQALIVVMHSIKTMKKEQYRMGVYKSLGYSNFYLTLTMLLANIIMMAIITAFSIGVSVVVSNIANYLIQNGFYFYTKYLIYYDLTIVTFRLDLVLIQCGITFGLLLLATFIPFIKIRMTKVNNIIKEAE